MDPKRIKDAGLRAWLLMNLGQDEGTGKFGWRANVAGILQGFKDHVGTKEYGSPPYILYSCNVLS